MLKDNIKKLRKAKGLSQEELAIKLNVVRQTISKWETGLSVPDSDMLIHIAETLDTSVNVLLDDPIKSDNDSELKIIANKLEIINEQFAKHNESRRKTWKIISCAVFVAAICILLGGLVSSICAQLMTNGNGMHISNIGGYDDPVNVYISNKLFNPLPFIMVLLSAIVSAIGIYKTRKK